LGPELIQQLHHHSIACSVVPIFIWGLAQASSGDPHGLALTPTRALQSVNENTPQA